MSCEIAEGEAGENGQAAEGDDDDDDDDDDYDGMTPAQIDAAKKKKAREKRKRIAEAKASGVPLLKVVQSKPKLQYHGPLPPKSHGKVHPYTHLSFYHAAAWQLHWAAVALP